MAIPESLGQFELLVLTAGTIQSKVRELAGPNQGSRGTIYVTPDRLED